MNCKGREEVQGCGPGGLRRGRSWSRAAVSASLTSLGGSSGLLVQHQSPHLGGALPLRGDTRDGRAGQPGRKLGGPRRLGPGKGEQAPGPTSPSVGAPPPAAPAARRGRAAPAPGPHQPPASRQTPHLRDREERRGRGRGRCAEAPPPSPGGTRRSPFVPQAAGTPGTNPSGTRCPPARRTASRAPRARSWGAGASRPLGDGQRLHARPRAHSPHRPPPGPLIRPRCWPSGRLEVPPGPPGPVAPPEHCTGARFPRARARACTRLSPSPSAPRRPPLQLPPPPPSPLRWGPAGAAAPGHVGREGGPGRALKEPPRAFWPFSPESDLGEAAGSGPWFLLSAPRRAGPAGRPQGVGASGASASGRGRVPAGPAPPTRRCSQCGGCGRRAGLLRAWLPESTQGRCGPAVPALRAPELQGPSEGCHLFPAPSRPAGPRYRCNFLNKLRV